MGVGLEESLPPGWLLSPPPGIHSLLAERLPGASAWGRHMRRDLVPAPPELTSSWEGLAVAINAVQH